MDPLLECQQGTHIATNPRRPKKWIKLKKVVLPPPAPPTPQNVYTTSRNSSRAGGSKLFAHWTFLRLYDPTAPSLRGSEVSGHHPLAAATNVLQHRSRWIPAVHFSCIANR